MSGSGGLRFVDVSGVGNSGKTAVVDILREIRQIKTFEPDFEFELFRATGGIIDLAASVYFHWSPVRSNQAISSFLRLVESMGLDPAWYDLVGLSKSCGLRYDGRFNGKFQIHSRTFVEGFVKKRYEALWPYNDFVAPPWWQLYLRIARRLGFRRVGLSKVAIVDAPDFPGALTQYMTRLFREIVGPDYHTVILHNAFEPYQPEVPLAVLEGSKQIIVTRDPRDVFANGVRDRAQTEGKPGFFGFGDKKKNWTFLNLDDVESFVVRYDTYMKHVYRKSNPNVLLLRFEDIAFNYDEVLRKIFDFLDVDPSHHIEPQRYFRPELSKKNIGVWSSHLRPDELKVLDATLSKYYYEGGV